MYRCLLWFCNSFRLAKSTPTSCSSALCSVDYSPEKPQKSSVINKRSHKTSRWQFNPGNIIAIFLLCFCLFSSRPVSPWNTKAKGIGLCMGRKNRSLVHADQSVCSVFGVQGICNKVWLFVCFKERFPTLGKIFPNYTEVLHLFPSLDIFFFKKYFSLNLLG